MAEATRRDVLIGSSAILANVQLALAGRAVATTESLGERQMRTILAADVAKSEKCVEEVPYSTLARVHRAIARDKLARFNRGEGRWLAYARKHPAGVSEEAVAIEEIRLELEENVSFLEKLLDKDSPRPSVRRLRVSEHAKAVARLEEFNQGEGRDYACRHHARLIRDNG